MRFAREASIWACCSLLVLLWSASWTPAYLACRCQAKAMIVKQNGTELTYAYSTGQTLAGGRFFAPAGTYKAGDSLVIYYDCFRQKRSFVRRFPYSAWTPVLGLVTLTVSLSWLLVAPEAAPQQDGPDIGFSLDT